MSSTIIQDILSKGKTINDELSKKIELLNQRNSNFNQELTKRLNDIINAIAAFKSTNLQGLTETKNKLSEVTNELETTKQNLQQTQSELERVKTELANTQTELQNANATKNELEQRVRDLDERMRQIELEYQNKINGVREEMAQKTTQEKKAMQEQFDQDMAALNNQKMALEKEIQEAKNKETEAINNLNALQKEQEGLIVNLGTINEFLARQLELISTINTEQPNNADYATLLETIQNGLTGVIGEINQAVATNTTPITSVSQTPLYDKFIKLNEDQQKEIYGVIGQSYADVIERDMALSPPDKLNIQNILKKYYSGDLLRGGRRRRKTMKKKHRKTHKLMNKYQRGGYIYSTSKELDRASSIISKSSRTKSMSNSKTRSKKYKYRKTSRK